MAIMLWEQLEGVSRKGESTEQCGDSTSIQAPWIAILYTPRCTNITIRRIRGCDSL